MKPTINLVFFYSDKINAPPTCSSNDEGRIQLQTVGSKGRVLEEFDELFDISLKIDIRQIRHHMSHNLK